MRVPKLRWLFYLAGISILGGGVLGFLLVLAYTAYAFFDSRALYGLHIPILGFGSLGAGVLGGGAFLFLAGLEKRVERLEANMAADSLGN